MKTTIGSMTLIDLYNGLDEGTIRTNTFPPLDREITIAGTEVDEIWKMIGLSLPLPPVWFYRTIESSSKRTKREVFYGNRILALFEYIRPRIFDSVADTGTLLLYPVHTIQCYDCPREDILALKKMIGTMTER